MILLKDSSVLYATNIGGVETTLCPEMMYALGVAAALKQEMFGLNLVITSLLDGHHNDGSLHPMGRAADLRDNDLKADEQVRWFQALKDELGPMGFDVVREKVGSTAATSGFHVHIEADPRGRRFWHTL